ncbi:uncharacterized protein LOC144611573 isoform X3 [Rhinoraja longicauda]
MDTSEELPRKVFKARKTMRTSDRQQLDAIYKSKEGLLKSNDETKTKLCNGRHENGDSDSKISLNTNCMDDTDIDSINDVRLGPEEQQGNSIDELGVAQTPELSPAEKCPNDDKDLKPQDEKIESTPPAAEDEQMSTENAESQDLIDNESKGDVAVNSEFVVLKEDSLIAVKSFTEPQSLLEEGKQPSVDENRDHNDVPDENSLKLKSSSSSVREKEDHESSMDISEEAISSSIESVQEKNGCESSKMERAVTENENTTKETAGECRSFGNCTLEIEEIIPILEKLAPEKDSELSNKQEVVPEVESPTPMDNSLQEEQMDTFLNSSPTKEECNGSLPEEAFLVLSDEDEPVIEKQRESEELVPKIDSPDVYHKEQAVDTRQRQEPNEVAPRKRSKSEDTDSSISKRCRYSGDKYEAALKVKITARGEIHETLEKIVQQIIEERISSMQSGVFDKKLAELKNRVEKIECHKRHESLICGLQAKLMQIEKRLGSANQARNDSILKKALEDCQVSSRSVAFKQQTPLQHNGTSYNACVASIGDDHHLVFEDNKSCKPLIKREIPLWNCNVSAESDKIITLKQRAVLYYNRSIKHAFAAGKLQVALNNDQAHGSLFEDIMDEHETPLTMSGTSKRSLVQLNKETSQVYDDIPVKEKQTTYNALADTTAVLKNIKTYHSIDQLALGQLDPLSNKTPKKPIPDFRRRLMIQANIPYNTKRATAWGVRTWDEWAKNRNNYLMENSMKCEELFLNVPLLSHEITRDQLNFWLCHFVEEVRQQDGSFYPPNSLRLLCCSILRYLRETCKRLDIDFFNNCNGEFSEFRTVLDRRIKFLKQQGIGTLRKQAQPYTEEDEEKLWQIVFQLQDAKSYSYAVYFYLCKVFGVHAATEHNRLVVDQFIFGTDEIGAYLEFVAKPYRGVTWRTKGRIRQYADSTNPRCIVSLFRRYLGMVPNSGPFYRRPFAGRLEFCRRALGVHTLERYSKEICDEGDISGHHTGQSGRISSVAALHSRGFDEELIKERMGNGSNAMMTYKKAQIKAVSDCLQPPNPLKKTTACSQSSSLRLQIVHKRP